MNIYLQLIVFNTTKVNYKEKYFEKGSFEFYFDNSV